MLRYTTDSARPGLVTFYDIRPGNGAGLFLQPGAHTWLSQENLPSLLQYKLYKPEAFLSSNQVLQRPVIAVGCRPPAIAGVQNLQGLQMSKKYFVHIVMVKICATCNSEPKVWATK